MVGLADKSLPSGTDGSGRFGTSRSNALRWASIGASFCSRAFTSSFSPRSASMAAWSRALAIAADRRFCSALSCSRRSKIGGPDRKSTRLNSSHSQISYAVFCLKKKKQETTDVRVPYHNLYNHNSPPHILPLALKRPLTKHPLLYDSTIHHALNLLVAVQLLRAL